MKKLSSGLLLLLFLVSCSGADTPDNNNHEKLFEHYAGITEFQGSAVITAQADDRETSFGFNIVSTGETSSLTLTSPAEIEGITVTLDANGLIIGYEGVSIETGTVDNTDISPAEFLPRLIYIWRNEAAIETGSEKLDDVQTLTAAWNSDGHTWRTWFDSTDYRPIVAELYSDGVRVMYCRFA